MKTLTEIATQTQKTLAQVALNWCISRPNVIAIPKSDSVTRTEENCTLRGGDCRRKGQGLDKAFS